MKKISIILTAFVMLTVGGCAPVSTDLPEDTETSTATGPVQPEEVPPEAEEGRVVPDEPITPAELLADPVYDEDVKMKGTVSMLGELFCPCFQLGEEGEYVEVWYDLMAVDSGAPWPKVDIGDLKNSDQVIAVGQLRRNTGSLPSKTFWLKSIEKTGNGAEPKIIRDPRTMTEEESAMMMEKLNTDPLSKALNDTMIQNMMVMRFDYYGDLANVTNGNTIRDLSFTGLDTSGKAEAVFKDGTYHLRALLYELPIPQDDSFYAGWLVRKEPDFSVLSTGKARLIDGRYVNTYRSEQDLTDYTFYVLTLEPDDGDPAPADHVLEGLMEQVD